MMESPLKFKIDPLWRGIAPDVIPARKALPAWLKDIPSDMPNQINGGKYSLDHTVKRCMPFLDAMSLGYIIPLWADFIATTDDTNVHIENKVHDFVTPHAADQIKGTPLGETQFGKNPKKFNSPWIIETEPGWSVLITSPINHFERRWLILTGIVDMDNYKAHVNFPFVWAQPNFHDIVKKGTPLAQIIPFRRSELASEAIIEDITEADKVADTMTKNTLYSQVHGGYRDNFWEKKNNKVTDKRCPFTGKTEEE